MTTQAPEQIHRTIEPILLDMREDLLRDTARLIQFQTVSGGNDEQERLYREQIPACLQWLKELSEVMGFRFRQWENRVAEIEWPAEGANGAGTPPVLGIASHIDVVTPAGKWTHPPFSGEIADGIMYGRGMQDDKGPLMQALYGLHAVRKSGIKLPCSVRLIIGTQEETGDWSDIAYYLEQRPAPDYAFTPDADFPLIIGEKGMCNVQFRAKWPRVAPHPETRMEFVSLAGGSRANIVPDTAEVRLRFPQENKNDVMKELVRETTRFTVENPNANVTLVPDDEAESKAQDYYEALVTFLGKAAHSSTPDKGHNAVADALRFFADIETLPREVRAFVQFLTVLASETDGSTLGIQTNHPFVGDTTAVLSLLDIGPEGGTALLNVRQTMGLSGAEVMRKAQEAVDAFRELSGLDVEIVRKGNGVDATYLDPDQPAIGEFLASLRKAYELVVGEPCRQVAIGGTTYAKAFPNCCAFGPVLPGVDEALAHQADEHMAVDSVVRNALIYGLSAALMANSGSGAAGN